MNSNDGWKLPGLFILGAILIAALYFDLLSPKFWKQNGPKLQTWVLENRQVLLIGAAALLFFVFALAIGIAMLKHARRAAIQRRVADGPTFLLLPRSDWRPVAPDKVNLWARLADALPHDEHISFEIAGSETEACFAVHGSEDGVRAALTQIKAEWPGVQRRPADPDPAAVPEGWSVFWVELRPHSWREPILSLADDPLRPVLVEVNGVIGRGRGLVQVIARNDFGTRARLGRAAFTARAGQVQNAGVRAIRTKQARSLEERAERAFLQVTIRCVGIADEKSRAEGIARGLARAVSSAYGHTNPVKPARSGRDPRPVLERRMSRRSQAWADDELSSLAHLVGSDMLHVAPRLKTGSAKSLPPDPEMRVLPTDVTAKFVEMA